MNELQERQISTQRESGKSYTEIARSLDLKVSAVKMFCSRNGILPKKKDERLCLNCGAQLKKSATGRTAKFCCTDCRVIYWKENSQKAKDHNRLCPVCGTRFLTYKTTRKYCCHTCYINARFKGATL